MKGFHALHNHRTAVLRVDISIDYSIGISIDYSIGISIDYSVDISIDISVDISIGISIDISIGISVDVFIDISVDASVGISTAASFLFACHYRFNCCHRRQKPFVDRIRKRTALFDVYPLRSESGSHFGQQFA